MLATIRLRLALMTRLLAGRSALGLALVAVLALTSVLSARAVAEMEMAAAQDGGWCGAGAGLGALAYPGAPEEAAEPCPDCLAAGVATDLSSPPLLPHRTALHHPVVLVPGPQASPAAANPFDLMPRGPPVLS